MAVTLAKVNGRTLEAEYREKAPAYFGPWIRRTTVVARTALEEQLEERLSDDELHDALLIDLVVRGRLRREPQSPEVYLAVEVSSSWTGKTWPCRAACGAYAPGGYLGPSRRGR